jgi:hypothetical protein
MAYIEQLKGDRLDRRGECAVAEGAARRTLRTQVARLEREHSGLLVSAFPHIVAAPVAVSSGTAALAAPPVRAPRLLGLSELERTRDALVGRVAGVRAQLAERAALERRSRDLLRRAREDPRRYKFLRIAVADLGEGTCGAWEVRPRFGPIGMAAGWWQLKLSSGCP